MKQTTEAYLSPKEAAEILHVSERTLYSWRETGEGPEWQRVGGRIRYNPRSVRDLVFTAAALAGRMAVGG